MAKGVIIGIGVFFLIIAIIGYNVPIPTHARKPLITKIITNYFLLEVL